MNLFCAIVPFVLVFASADAGGGDGAYEPTRQHTLDQINVHHRLLDANDVLLLQHNLEIQEASQTTIRSNGDIPKAVARASRLPNLFIATHHKSGTVLARGLGESLVNVLGSGSWGPFFARGIDWNSTGTPGELINPPCNFKGCKQFAQDPCPPAKQGPTMGIFQNMNMPTLARLNAGCANYRMIHLIRDPVALTVSAYWYHSRVANDTAEPGRLNPQQGGEMVPARIGPEVYGNLSLFDGLKVESEMELNTTLRMMHDVVSATYQNANVLTVPLEQLSSDFDSTVRQMYSFLVGDAVDESTMEELMKGAEPLNNQDHESVMWLGQEHISSVEDTERAMREWQAHPSEQVFNRVEGIRMPLGYTDQGRYAGRAISTAPSFGQIPRVLHQSWKNSVVPETLSPYTNTWRTTHPEWKFVFWTDEDNARLWSSQGQQLSELYNTFAEPVIQSDASRILYMREYGGVYADLDVEPCANLDWLLNKYQLVLVRSPVGFASNFFIASVPWHPFWDLALDELPRVDERLAQGKEETKEELAQLGLEFGKTDEIMWTAGPNFLDIVLAKFEERQPDGLDGIKVFEFEEWQAEVGIHHWTGTWHCHDLNNKEIECNETEKFRADPTEGADKGVNVSNRCSAAHGQDMVSTHVDTPALKDVCFVHVGKCGGMSINIGLDQLKESGDISSLVQVHGHRDEIPGTLPGPLVGRSFEQCASSGNVLFWVRDPVSRFVSIWKFFADPGYTEGESLHDPGYAEKPLQRDDMRSLIVDHALNDSYLAPVADNPSTLTQLDIDMLLVNLFSTQNSTLQQLFFNKLPHGSETLSWYLADCAALAILPIAFVGTVEAMDTDWERFLQYILRVQNFPLPHTHHTNYANHFLSQFAVSSLRQFHAKDYLCLAKLVDARWLPTAYLDDVTSTTKLYAY